MKAMYESNTVHLWPSACLTPIHAVRITLSCAEQLVHDILQIVSTPVLLTWTTAVCQLLSFNQYLHLVYKSVPAITHNLLADVLVNGNGGGKLTANGTCLVSALCIVRLDMHT
eukprot:GHRR01037084.1.p1 GENE.GHRR01037084.1~~GHRR01037084.1.p1  ORF type:complete len:113 (-),score=20.98 GHRR01037084.1:107-445(-)